MSRFNVSIGILIALGVGLAITWAWAAAAGADDWLHFRSTNELAPTTWHVLPASQVHTVTPAATAEALKLVADRPYRSLNDQEARDLGRKDPPAVGLASYLVRAVKNAGASGAYKVLTDGASVVVQHGSLGRHSAWQKDALIVDLPSAPQSLFVEVSVAE